MLKLTTRLLCLFSLSLAFPLLAHEHQLNYLIVNKLSAPFQLVDQEQSSGGIITRIVEESATSTDKELVQVVSTRHRNKVLKKTLETPWITYSAKVWQPNLDHARFVDVPLFDVRHSAVTCVPDFRDATSSQSLNGRNLAILENFDYPELQPLAEQGLITLTEVSDYQQGFMMVKHGRVDGFVEMTMRLDYNLSQMQDDNTPSCYRMVDLSAIIKPFPIYLIVSDKLDDNNFQRLDKSLRALKSSGRIAELIESHLKTRQ